MVSFPCDWRRFQTARCHPCGLWSLWPEIQFEQRLQAQAPEPEKTSLRRLNAEPSQGVSKYPVFSREPLNCLLFEREVCKKGLLALVPAERQIVWCRIRPTFTWAWGRRFRPALEEPVEEQNRIDDQQAPIVVGIRGVAASWGFETQKQEVECHDRVAQVESALSRAVASKESGCVPSGALGSPRAPVIVAVLASGFATVYPSGSGFSPGGSHSSSSCSCR